LAPNPPTPNPQSPIPNPHILYNLFLYDIILLIKMNKLNTKKNLSNIYIL